MSGCVTAFESRYLPDERVVGIHAAKPALLEHGEHLPRRVGKCPELFSPQPEKQILRGDQETRDEVARRIAEYEQTLGVVAGRAEKTLVVGVAADDAVQHDYVCRLDADRIGGDVVKTPLDSVVGAGLAEKPGRFLLIGRRELEVDRPAGAPLQELNLYLAHSATDFEDCRARDSVFLEKRNHPPRRLVDPLLSVTLRSSTGRARSEEVVTAAGVAAASQRPAA